MYLLPSTGQTWIHILVLPVFEPHVHVLGEIWDTSSHPHTSPTRFTWSAKLTQIWALLQIFTWLRTKKCSKSSKESLLKSHPGITSNERTKEPTEWVLHLILSSVSAWGIRFTIRYQHDCFATGYLKSLFRHV